MGSSESREQCAQDGVLFADAVGVLEDDGAVTLRDDVYGEKRWVTMGMDAVGRILAVVYIWRGKNKRILSARLATPVSAPRDTSRSAAL